MTSFSYTIINPFSRFTTAMIIYWEWHYYTFMLYFLFYFFLYSHDRTMQDIVYKLVPNLQESKCLVRHQYIGLLADSPQQFVWSYHRPFSCYFSLGNDNFLQKQFTFNSIDVVYFLLFYSSSILFKSNSTVDMNMHILYHCVPSWLQEKFFQLWYFIFSYSGIWHFLEWSWLIYWITIDVYR